MEAKKAKLLQLAEDGKPRPSGAKDLPLYKAFIAYTRPRKDGKKGFDPVLTKKLKKSASHWF